MLATQSISRWGSILRSFLSSGESAIKSFEGFFGLPQMSGVINSLPLRVGVEMSQPNIKSDRLGCWFSFLYPFSIDTKLAIISIGSTDNPHSFDLLQLIFVQIASTLQLKTSSFKPVGEVDSSSIERKFPSCRFIFDFSDEFDASWNVEIPFYRVDLFCSYRRTGK